jgi:hypothetical protein
MFIYFLPKKWEGYYAYSSIVGVFLHIVGIISLSLLRSRHYIPRTPTPHDLFRFGS